MTAKREMGIFQLNTDVLLCRQKDSSNNKGDAFILNPLVRLCEQGSHVWAFLLLVNILSKLLVV